MRLTTRGRYAVTAILDLVLHQVDGPVTLDHISKRQGIALSYLGQLFAQLRRQGLVNSRRGPGGGYFLAKAPEQIALSEVIDAVDERLDTTRCGGKSNCHNDRQCLTHSLWERLGGEIHRLLSEVSLANAIKDSALREVAQRQDRETYGDIVLPLKQKSIASYITGGHS